MYKSHSFDNSDDNAVLPELSFSFESLDEDIEYTKVNKSVQSEYKENKTIFTSRSSSNEPSLVFNREERNNNDIEEICVSDYTVKKSILEFLPIRNTLLEEIRISMIQEKVQRKINMKKNKNISKIPAVKLFYYNNVDYNISDRETSSSEEDMLGNNNLFNFNNEELEVEESQEFSNDELDVSGEDNELFSGQKDTEDRKAVCEQENNNIQKEKSTHKYIDLYAECSDDVMGSDSAENEDETNDSSLKSFIDSNSSIEEGLDQEIGYEKFFKEVQQQKDEKYEKLKKKLKETYLERKEQNDQELYSIKNEGVSDEEESSDVEEIDYAILNKEVESEIKDAADIIKICPSEFTNSKTKYNENDKPLFKNIDIITKNSSRRFQGFK